MKADSLGPVFYLLYEYQIKIELLIQISQQYNSMWNLLLMPSPSQDMRYFFFSKNKYINLFN